MERFDRILAVAGSLYLGATLLLGLVHYGAPGPRVFYLVSLLLLAPAIAACMRTPLAGFGTGPVVLLGAVGLFLSLRVALTPTLEARGYLLALLGWTGVALGLWMGSHRGAARTLVAVLLLAGAFEAMIGFTQSLGGADRIFDYHRSLGRIATGTFINRNHFAGFLNLILALAVGLLFAGYGRGRRRRQSAAESWGRAWLVLLVAAFIGLAALLSQSRGGVLTLVAVLALVGTLLILKSRQPGGSGALPPQAVGALLIVTLVLGGIVGFGSWTERFGELSDPLRPQIYADTLDLIAEHPVRGVGPAMFEWRFGAYQTADTDKWVRHAHNDYLQTAAEWGVPIAVLFWLFLVWRLARSVRLFFAAGEPDQQGLALTGAAAIFGILIHSLVDFNLQVPINLFTFGALVGLTWAAESGAPAGPSRWPVVAGRLLVCAGLVVAAGPIRNRLMAQAILDGPATLEALESAAAWDPESPDVHERLGRRTRTGLGDEGLRAARAHLERAAALNPYSRSVQFELGLVYEALGDGELAEQALVRATAGPPPVPGHLWRLGNFYVRRGRVEKARAPLGKALAGDESLWGPGLQLLTKMSVGPEELDEIWPRTHWARLKLLRELTGWERATGRGLYRGLVLDQWTALLEGARPLTPAEGSFFLEYLIAIEQPTEARRQWIALARANGSSDPAFESEANTTWNGSFELPFSEGYFDWTARPPEGVSIERLSGVGPDGSAAVRVDLDGSRNVEMSALSQRIIVRPGARYRLTFDARREGLTTDRGVSFELVDQRQRRIVLETEPLLGSGPWQSHEAVFEVAAGSFELSLRLRRKQSRRIDNRISGSLWIDNVRIEPLPVGELP